MYEIEDVVLMMVKERMNDRMRYVADRRALRLARAHRPSMKLRLGMALIRFGQWLMGESAPSAGSPARLRQVQY